MIYPNLSQRKNRMNTSPLNTLFAAAGLLAVACTAQAQEIKPGQYEYVTKTEVMGMSIPVTFKQCVTQKDVDTHAAYANQKGAQGCSTPQVARQGKEITIQFTCTHPKLTGVGKGVVGEEDFSMQMNVTQHELNNSVVRTQLSAKRLGNC
jgi:hypothetical protein